MTETLSALPASKFVSEARTRVSETIMKVQIWSDVVCPWCYIGKRRFEAAVGELGEDVEVEWKSFQLDPSAPRVSEQPIESVLARKYRMSSEQAQAMIDRVTSEAAGAGLEIDLRNSAQLNTFDAHRLLQFAKDQGLGEEMKERLLSAHFVEGKTLLDDQLVALAEEVGLPRDEAAAVVSGDAYGDEVRRDLAEARSLGVTGVPFFVVEGRYGFAGAQPPETMLQVLRRAQQELGPSDDKPDTDGGKGAASCAVPDDAI